MFPLITFFALSNPQFYTVFNTESSTFVLVEPNQILDKALIIGDEAIESNLTESANWRPCASDGYGKRKALKSELSPTNPSIAISGLDKIYVNKRLNVTGDQISLARQMLLEITGKPINLRTLTKIPQKNAPPVFVAVGESDCNGIVAIFDLISRKELSHLEIDLPGRICAPLSASSAFDINNDGAQELFLRAGNGAYDEGLFRGVVTLEENKLTLIWSESIPVFCLR